MRVFALCALLLVAAHHACAEEAPTEVFDLNDLPDSAVGAGTDVGEARLPDGARKVRCETQALCLHAFQTHVRFPPKAIHPEYASPLQLPENDQASTTVKRKPMYPAVPQMVGPRPLLLAPFNRACQPRCMR